VPVRIGDGLRSTNTNAFKANDGYTKTTLLFGAFQPGLPQNPNVITAIQQGELTLSKARRVTSVITPQNQAQWIQKASTLSQRELEKQVAIINPTAVVSEKITPKSAERSELRVALDKETECLLKKAQG